MTTQAQLMTSARSRLDEATARMWTDLDLRIWINEGARHIARNTLALEDRETIVGGIGTAEYPINANAIQISRVEFTRTGQDTIALTFADKKNMDNYGWSQRSRTSYQPDIYTVVGSGRTLKLLIFPAPANAGSFTVWYYRLPVALAEATTADATTNIEIPQGYDDILLDYIEYRALRKDRDPRWTEAKALYDENLGLMFDATRRWVDEAGMIMPQSGGVPSWLSEMG